AMLVPTTIGAAAPPTPVSSPAPTSDPIIDRLEQLEARVRQLEARNAEPEEKARAGEALVAAAEKGSDKAVRFGWGPSFSHRSGDFTVEPRGVSKADVAAFVERRGGYVYNTGTAVRRARIGFVGTAFKSFHYRIE